MALHIVILAAGKGTRMNSTVPKVLHKLAGKPMLSRVIDTALQLKPEAIHVVIGNGGEEIKQSLPFVTVNWVVQSQQLGTGHAVRQALAFIPNHSQVLVLYADVPLIQTDTLLGFIELCNSKKTDRSFLGLLVANLSDPSGLGRVHRDHKRQVKSIIEEKDATLKEREIKEIYSGICYVEAENLHQWLPKLNCKNAQEEYYLTEIVAMAVLEQIPVVTYEATDVSEIQGVNDRFQLQELERIYQSKLAKKLMLSGVSIADINRMDIRGELICGKDVFIDINNLFEGNVTIGDHCSIGPNCYLKNVTLGSHSKILANSVIEDSFIGENCHIGPFSRIRPNTTLGNHCKIGNFVEIKNTTFNEQSKANHLSYVGDATIGKHVNIGAGTITCNYDGVNKHQTIIEDGVLIGSDTQLIAPIKVGKNATIGAGSTICKDVPADELTLTEAHQKTIRGWKRPSKE